MPARMLFLTNNDGETLLQVIASAVVETFYVPYRAEPDVLEPFRYLIELGLYPLKEDRKRLL